jgi:hypothetical protein
MHPCEKCADGVALLGGLCAACVGRAFGQGVEALRRRMDAIEDALGRVLTGSVPPVPPWVVPSDPVPPCTCGGAEHWPVHQAYCSLAGSPT